MSKAFTKDDAVDEPILVPSRPPLPEGLPNYVTRRGLAALRSELQALQSMRSTGLTPPGDRVRELAAMGEQIANLEARIASATVVEAAAQPTDQVRFGAYVTLCSADGVERTLQIVGVDEADIEKGRIAFTAPLARALLGKEEGDTVLVRAPRGKDTFDVVKVWYEVEPA